MENNRLYREFFFFLRIKYRALFLKKMRSFFLQKLSWPLYPCIFFCCFFLHVLNAEAMKKNIPFSLGKAYGRAGRWGLYWHYSRESQAFITITVINHGWLTITLHTFNYAPGRGVPNSIDLLNWLQSEVKTLLIRPCGCFLLSVWTLSFKES